MKKKSVPEQTKYFRFQFSRLITLLSVAALVCSILGIALSVYRIYANDGLKDFNDWLKFPFLILVAFSLLSLS